MILRGDISIIRLILLILSLILSPTWAASVLVCLRTWGSVLEVVPYLSVPGPYLRPGLPNLGPNLARKSLENLGLENLGVGPQHLQYYQQVTPFFTPKKALRRDFMGGKFAPKRINQRTPENG